MGNVPSASSALAARRERRKGEGYRRESLSFRYGLTLEQYQVMLDKQRGVCAICHQPETAPRVSYLSVDHNHRCCPGRRSCGKCIRGLLCSACNRLLGTYNDNPIALAEASKTAQAVFLAAAAYLSAGS